MNRSIVRNAIQMLCVLVLLASMLGTSAAPVQKVSAQAPAQAQAGTVTDTWAVQVQPGTDVDALAQVLGAQNLGQIGALEGYYLFRILGTDSEVTAAADAFAASEQVIWFEQQVLRKQSKRDAPVGTNPLRAQQWHLSPTSNFGANVEAAWTAGYTGTGVTIALVDDGLQTTNPDLDGNYALAGSWDYNGPPGTPYPYVGDNDPSPYYTNYDYHGTAVAGVAAADDDSSCGVGVAYKANLSGIRLISAYAADADEAGALNYAPNINSIYSNSWGPTDAVYIPAGDPWELTGPGPLTQTALNWGVTNGRNGKGSIYVWAAGNGLDVFQNIYDNVNYDGYANSRYVIAVGASNYIGGQSEYSEPGAALFVVAPSSGSGQNIITTDLYGTNQTFPSIGIGYNSTLGPNEGCTLNDNNFGGTSAAAPLVSGIVALMLQRNPNLGWRDVQNILARTAVQTDPADLDWITNTAGLHVNHKYGFGLVDAAAAVNMANPATYINLGTEVAVSSSLDTANVSIPDNDLVTGVTRTLNISQNIRVERAVIHFTANHTYRGDLKIVLTAPSGTQSVLAERHDDPGDNYSDWTFSTVRNWGELSAGDWSIKVTDESGGDVGTLVSWKLDLYGSAAGTFADVPTNYWAWSWIENLYSTGITSGCAVTPVRNYCPTSSVTRAQMAVFLLKSKHGKTYVPPAVGASTGFADVPITHWAAAWIKQLAAEGITSGCAGGNYCPENPVTREQMAVFLLRSEHGSVYTPPSVGASTGFNDVAVDNLYAPWIKQLAAEAITSGCSAGMYCPLNSVTRAQMAVFLIKTFALVP